MVWLGCPWRVFYIRVFPWLHRLAHSLLFLHTRVPMAPQTFLFPLASFAVYSGAAIIFLIVKEFGLIFFFFFTLTLQFFLNREERNFRKREDILS